MRTLRKIAAIIFVIDTAIAQISCFCRLIKGHSRMSKSFKLIAAMGTLDRLNFNRLMTAGTFSHDLN